MPEHIPAPRVKIKASRLTAGLKLTPCILHPEKGIVLPGVLLESGDSSSQGPVILYLHDKGKANIVAEKAAVHSLLAQGLRVCAVDLRGQGETGPSEQGKFWDFLAGKPIFGQRVGDILSILRWLSQPQVNAEGIYVWAQGVTALYVCHAAAIDETISGLVLEEPLLCFESVVTMKAPAYRHEVILPGALERYDLPQVYQALCPRKITLINPLRADRSQAAKDEVERAWRPASETYRVLGIPDNFKTFTEINSRQKPGLLLSNLMEMAQDK